MFDLSSPVWLALLPGSILIALGAYLSVRRWHRWWWQCATTSNSWYWRALRWSLRGAFHVLCRAMVWLVWLATLSAVDLTGRRVDEGTLARIWGFFWGYMTSPDMRDVCVPRAVKLPRLTIPLPYGGRKICSMPEWVGNCLLLALILTGTWVVNQMSVQVNALNGDFMNSITERNSELFYHVLLQFSLVLAAYCLLAPGYTQLKQIYILEFMRHVTRVMMGLWLRGGNQYAIAAAGHPDNPNVRLWDNVREMCSKSLVIVFDIIESLLILYSFSGVLWAIESQLTYTVNIGGQPWQIPHLLMLSLGLYAWLGTNGSARVGGELVELNYKQAELGGHYRRGLVLAEKYAEQIAVYRSEGREQSNLLSRYFAALRNSYLITSVQRNLSFFTGVYDKTSDVLPFAVLAPFFFANEIKFGDISQAVGACGALLAALSLVVSRFETIAELFMATDRVGELRESLLEIEDGKSKTGEHIARREGTVDGDRLLKVKDVTLFTSDGGKLIVRGLDFELSAGENIVITGASGSGKSSILRAIEGLIGWNRGSGSIEIISWDRVTGLSQLAYTLEGVTLREQLLDDPYADVEDTELIDALHKVGLSGWLADLAGRLRAEDEEVWNVLPGYEQRSRILDARPNWDTLSGGEKQRLIAARALVRKIDLLLADEFTSALDEVNTLRLYEVISQAGIAMLTVAHNPAVLQFADRVLHLKNDGAGGWELKVL